MRDAVPENKEGSIEKMIAHCGLVCTDCEAYLATQRGDMDALARLAERARKEFGVDLPPHAHMCNGCLATSGRQIPYCGTCAIRACGVVRQVANCGHCPDYPCETLLPHASADQKATLDAIRANLPPR